MSRAQTLAIAAGAVGLVLLFSLPFVLEEDKAKEDPVPDPPVLVVPVPVPEIKSLEIRRPIAGAPGQALVIAADGSSWLERDGQRTMLAPATPAPAPAVKAIPLPPTDVEVPGQLIVLDKGVVQIPIGALITFLDDDHVVTHDPGGDTVAYWIDGRVDRRNRFPRPSVSLKK